MKPLFEHDCDACTFLGHNDEGTMDLYFCPQLPGLPTVIARFSDNGPDYMSGIAFAPYNPNINKAVRLAKERGLLE